MVSIDYAERAEKKDVETRNSSAASPRLRKPALANLTKLYLGGVTDAVAGFLPLNSFMNVASDIDAVRAYTTGTWLPHQ